MDSKTIQRFRGRLIQMSDGRNRSFLYSFGGKDADLEPWGDWGIQTVEATSNGVVATIRGYKTFCDPVCQFELPPEQVEVENEVASWILRDVWTDDTQNYCCDEEGWYCTVELKLRVRWRKRYGKISLVETAEHLIKQVEIRRKPYIKAWTEVDDQLNEQYKRLDKQTKETEEK